MAPDVLASASRSYRPDIDGLRAVAVVAVLLFHADLNIAGGGFVGVDIFFVISGYLITTIIASELERERFSLARFYERRVRRIFPALFATLAGCSIAGFFLFLPREFADFGTNIIGATVFSSNIFFWKQAGYFDGSAETKPLLHTWSLAVEEQFYIAFPLFLMLVWRVLGKRAALAIWPIALVSFALSAWATRTSPSAAFYLTPFRAWELLLGSLLALGAIPQLRGRASREVLALLGAGLVLWAIFGFSDRTPFPGLNALLPCLGAALLIYSGERDRSLINRALSSRPFVFVGLISYSLYLLHWPLFVFARYQVIHELSLWQSLGVIALSFGFAFLSWRYVEMPFRRKNAVLSRKPLFQTAAIATASAALLGLMIGLANGWPGRFSPTVSGLASYAESTNPHAARCGSVGPQLAANSPCTIGDPRTASIFLWGDSHADALYGAFRELAADGTGTIYAATPLCPPLIGIGTDRACMRANERRLAFIRERENIRTIVLAARWPLYFEGRAVGHGPAETNGHLPPLINHLGNRYPQFSAQSRTEFRNGLGKLVERLLAAGKTVLLVYPIPETGYDIPSTLARIANKGGDPASFTTPERVILDRQRLTQHLLDSLGQHDRLKRIYPTQALCRAGRCATYADGAALYFDDNHLSIPGAQLLLPQLRGALAPL